MTCRGDCNREPEAFGFSSMWFPTKQGRGCLLDYRRVRWLIAIIAILLMPWKMHGYFWLFKKGTFEELDQDRHERYLKKHHQLFSEKGEKK